MSDLETRIGEWRSAVLRGRAVDTADADELEEHLREQIADLETAGLTESEAFLIAVGRLGEVDVVTAEFAREHSDRLWKQLALARPAEEGGRRSFVAMLVFAALAIIAIQVARVLAVAQDGSASMLFGDTTADWFLRNLGFYVLPVLAAYLVVLRRIPWQRVAWLAGFAAAVALAINLYPYTSSSATEPLVGLHLPVLLWFVVGVAYVAGELLSHTRRMDFIRFTGEWAIYFILIVLGGGLLITLTIQVLAPIAPDSIDAVLTWVLPSGGAAGVIVAAWLVEAKKSVVENLAPVLTAIFTPLFAVMLLVAAVGYVLAGIGREFDRELLSVFDVLMLVVLALVVYGISARGTGRGARVMDAIRLAAVVAAILLDVLVLASMLTRIGELGLTPNRVAALGLNVLLLVNLAGSAWLGARQLATRGSAARLERWQTGYLAVFAAWVLVVVVVLPPLFGFA